MLQFNVNAGFQQCVGRCIVCSRGREMWRWCWLWGSWKMSVLSPSLLEVIKMLSYWNDGCFCYFSAQWNRYIFWFHATESKLDWSMARKAEHGYWSLKLQNLSIILVKRKNSSHLAAKFKSQIDRVKFWYFGGRKILTVLSFVAFTL